MNSDTMTAQSGSGSDPNRKPADTRLADRAPPPHALDGSQYHNIIEEQLYAEQPPTAQEQTPWRIFHPDSGKPDAVAPDEPSISVGPR